MQLFVFNQQEIIFSIKGYFVSSKTLPTFPTLCLLCQVDVDIKLRSCKGSCRSYTEFQVDREDYVVLDKQVRYIYKMLT